MWVTGCWKHVYSARSLYVKIANYSTITIYVKVMDCGAITICMKVADKRIKKLLAARNTIFVPPLNATLTPWMTNCIAAGCDHRLNSVKNACKPGSTGGVDCLCLWSPKLIPSAIPDTGALRARSDIFTCAVMVHALGIHAHTVLQNAVSMHVFVRASTKSNFSTLACFDKCLRRDSVLSRNC